MPTTNNLQSPTEAPLVSPSSEMVPATDLDSADNGKVKMKKQLGLVEGTAIILGIIFGSGELSFHNSHTEKEKYWSLKLWHAPRILIQ